MKMGQKTMKALMMKEERRLTLGHITIVMAKLKSKNAILRMDSKKLTIIMDNCIIL
jgi:hypothetical protein